MALGQIRKIVRDRGFGFIVPSTGGKDVFSRSGPVELVLHPSRNRAGGKVLGGNRQARLSEHRLAMLRRLIERPQGVPMEDLLDEFYLVPKGLSVGGTSGSPATREEIEKEYRNLRKFVCDTNDKLEKISPGWRPIVQIEGRYVLQARARIASEN